MKVKIVLFVPFLLYAMILNSQEFENRLIDEAFHFRVGQRISSNHFHPGYQIAFNEAGNVSYILSPNLYPVYRDTVPNYLAVYTYADNENVMEEHVYFMNEDTVQEFRFTKYEQKHDTLLVRVWNKDSELVAKILEIKDGNQTRRNYIADTILPYSMSTHNSNVVLDYDSGELNQLILDGNQNKHHKEFILKRKGRMTIISERHQNDSLSWSMMRFRFYDKKGRLTNISSTDKRRKWHSKFYYNRKGLLTRITRRGRQMKTGKMVTSIIEYQQKISRKIDLNDHLRSKINDELINLQYPITGRMQYLNYLDSRRFISHHN